MVTINVHMVILLKRNNILLCIVKISDSLEGSDFYDFRTLDLRIEIVLKVAAFYYDNIIKSRYFFKNIIFNER